MVSKQLFGGGKIYLCIFAVSLTVKYMKILIIRFSSMGDIVLTTPVIRCLKLQTGAFVHYLTKKGFGQILNNNPYIDRVWTIERSVSEVLGVMKHEQYDLIIDLHNNLRTLQVKWSLGVKSYSFDKLNWEKWLMVRFKINRLPDVHIVDRYMDTIKSLGVENDGKGLDYFIPDQDEVKVGELRSDIALRSDQYIAFVIGAQHYTKRLPEHKIIEWCKEIKLPVVVLGGKDELEAGSRIAEGSGIHVVNLCGQLNLNQSASVVRQAQAVISHDTGLMHIAAAFGKKIYSVWGNTIPEFGMYPYYSVETPKDWNVQLEVKSLDCRPCSKIGFSACPKGHFKCMEEQVWDGKNKIDGVD